MRRCRGAVRPLPSLSENQGTAPERQATAQPSAALHETDSGIGTEA